MEYRLGPEISDRFPISSDWTRNRSINKVDGVRDGAESAVTGSRRALCVPGHHAACVGVDCAASPASFFPALGAAFSHSFCRA